MTTRAAAHTGPRPDRNHRYCPGRCGRLLADHYYVCGPCWRALPGDVKRAITAAAGQPLLSPARTRAFTAAADFYACRAAGIAPGLA